MAVIVVNDWPEFITAVGTSGAVVEFPKNLVLTSDNQIVEGKLYVDSAGEPITNPLPSGLSGYYENTFVLDMNDYEPEGITTQINIACTEFNGNGGKILNLNLLNTTAKIKGTYSTTFKNTNLDNLAINGVFMETFSEVKKNIFSVIDSISSVLFNKLTLRQNSVYYKNTSQSINNPAINNSLWSYQSEFNRIILDAPNAAITIKGLQNTLITGKAQSLSLSEGMDCCVIDCVADTFSGGRGGSNQINLVNSDKIGTISASNVYKPVTTEDLTNAETLANLGFPIQT